MAYNFLKGQLLSFCASLLLQNRLSVIKMREGSTSPFTSGKHHGEYFR